MLMLTPAQLKMRQTGLGGSDIAVALGHSPWKTQLELWAEKTGKKEGSGQNDLMEWGSRLESAIYQKFKDEHPELRMSYGAGTVRHEKFPFLLATPDGFIGNDGILEIKTSSQKTWEEVPLHYLLQLQHYMYVTNRRFGYFAVLFNGTQYREYGPFEMNREQYEKQVLPKLEMFWDSVEKGVAIFVPSKISELAFICEINPELEPMDMVDRAVVLVDNIREAQHVMKATKEVMDEAKLELAELMGDNPKMIDADGKTVAVQIQTKDSMIVDNRKLKKLHPEIFEECSKVRKGSRSLRVY
jgi:putative phage-type endonuclease